MLYSQLYHCVYSEIMVMFRRYSSTKDLVLLVIESSLVYEHGAPVNATINNNSLFHSLWAILEIEMGT